MNSKLQKIKFTKKSLSKAPHEAGIYIFWDKKGHRLYIGKSTNLRNRILSYTTSAISGKTLQLIKEAEYFSYIRVTSELEALLLEAKLVKNYQPPYNSQLKDDKHPLYIRITKEKYPQVLTARRIDEENPTAGGKNIAFFGPFPASGNVKSVLKMLRGIFPYAQHKPGKRGCLYSQICQCNPCPSVIEKENDELLKKKMTKKYRKNVRLIIDVLSGKIKTVRDMLTKEMKFYAMSEKFEDAMAIHEQIKRLDYITQPITPVSEFLKNPNLIEDIRDEEERLLRKILSGFIRVEKISRIEAYDVAHLAGTYPTASMVTFVNGEPDKKFYRHFKIYQKKGRDDLSSMKEVAERRVAHFDDWGTPDLLIVDGGKPQVGIFWGVMKGYGIPVVGLAKRLETLVIPYTVRSKLAFREIVVPRGRALNLLQRLRNEAHRFARRLHHKLLQKELIFNNS